MKIVLAVDEDKQSIVKKTGQAPYYVIYEDTKPIAYVASRLEDGHGKNLEALQGCDVFLVQAVGEHMRETLEAMGIEVKKIRQKHGSTADEVVQNFLNGNI